MYVCVYVSFCNVCCIPTIINKWVNCNLTWMWRRLLAARSPRSLRSSREQVGTNLKKKRCLWDFSSIKLFHTWEWWLVWPRGSWAIAAQQRLSWLLTKTRLHLTPWKSVRTYHPRPHPRYHPRSPNISAKTSPVDVRAIPVHADFSNPGSLAQSNTDLTKNLTIG